MNAKKIFITGASGCIGHYLVETLIQQTNHELYLLVRNRDKLKIDSKARPGIHILESDLREISRWKDILKTTNVAILAATAWGGTQEVFDINVIKTIKLLRLLNPEVCQQVVYFSTATFWIAITNYFKKQINLGLIIFVPNMRFYIRFRA